MNRWAYVDKGIAGLQTWPKKAGSAGIHGTAGLTCAAPHKQVDRLTRDTQAGHAKGHFRELFRVAGDAIPFGSGA
jgi:hypothetical protein